MARIAVPVAQGFEDSELTVPYERLSKLGHELVTLGTRMGEEVKGKRGGASARVQVTAGAVEPDSFDALFIPGGYAPDKLRMDPDVVAFVRGFCGLDRTVAAICHGAQLLIEADAVRGRTLTSYPSIRKDLENAGARWVDEPVVEDGNLITSRRPDDLDAFCAALEERL